VQLSWALAVPQSFHLLHLFRILNSTELHPLVLPQPA
jgi:hypothetical protein